MKDASVRLSVTSPPPAFANPVGALSPPSASVISPFGSPSGWISGRDGGEGAVAAAGSSTDKTSNVHINGDHVTQVRVDALVLTPTTGESSGSRPSQRQQEPPDQEDDVVVVGGSSGGKEEEEDRDQSELLVTTRLAVSSSVPSSGSRDQLHVTAVQVEHTSNAHHQQDAT